MARPKANLETLRLRLERARKGFSSLLSEYEKAGGRYVDRAPILPHRLVQDCRVYQDRYHLLESLPKDGVVAEIGTDRGDFAAKIMELAKPAVLHIFERDISRIQPENIAVHVQSGKCDLHVGDSSTEMEKMDNASFDWIYIDGDHSYHGVRRDIAAAASKVKAGGFIIFNDYAVWSVTSMRRCGVAKAANEFAIASGWRMAKYAFQTSMYCDAAFVKPG